MDHIVNWNCISRPCLKKQPGKKNSRLTVNVPYILFLIINHNVVPNQVQTMTKLEAIARNLAQGPADTISRKHTGTLVSRCLASGAHAEHLARVGVEVGRG